MIRKHGQPRLSLFIPTKDCPVPETSLTGVRKTVVQRPGRAQVITDNYRTEARPRRALMERWLGETQFELRPEASQPARPEQTSTASRSPGTFGTTSTTSRSPGTFGTTSTTARSPSTFGTAGTAARSPKHVRNNKHRSEKSRHVRNNKHHSEKSVHVWNNKPHCRVTGWQAVI